jgi:hypothetical protein
MDLLQLLLLAMALVAVVGLGLGLALWLRQRRALADPAAGPTRELYAVIARYREAEKGLAAAGQSTAQLKSELDRRIDELRMERGAQAEMQQRRVEREQALRQMEEVRRLYGRLWQVRLALEGGVPLVILQWRMPDPEALQIIPPPGGWTRLEEVRTGWEEARQHLEELASRAEADAALLAEQRPRDDAGALQADGALAGAVADHKTHVAALHRYAGRMRKLAERLRLAVERADGRTLPLDEPFRGLSSALRDERLEADDALQRAQQMVVEDEKLAATLISQLVTRA